MCILYVKYLSYLCQYALTVNGHLANLYHQYSFNSKEKEYNLDSAVNDDELKNFLINLIDTAEYWSNIETAKAIDNMVLDYDRRSDLIRYMHQVNHLEVKHKTFLIETFLDYLELANYQFADSRLVDLQVDRKKQFCMVKLENVLLYSERRKNKDIPVDFGSLILTFHNTQKVEMKGELNLERQEINRVYAWHIMEAKDNQRCFCLLTLLGSRCFILQITCSQITSKVYS